MDSDAVIRDLLAAAVAEVNLTAPPDQQCPTDPEAILFGAGGSLDSLGLVNLIVAVEQGIADRLGITLALADDQVMSRRHSPFRTLEAMRAYLAERLHEVARG